MVADLCSEKNKHIPFLYILLIIIMKLLFNNKSYFWISRVLAHVKSWWMAYLPWVHASMHAKLFQSYLALCDPMDYSPPGSSIHGIPQARILEWVAMPSSKGPSQPRDWTCISCVYLHWQAGSLPLVPPGKPCLPHTFDYQVTELPMKGTTLWLSQHFSSFAPSCLSVGWGLGLALQLMMNLWLCTSGKDNPHVYKESISRSSLSIPHLKYLYCKDHAISSIYKGPG